MTTEIRPAHSPLGASGAERWMNCAGSVALLKELKLPESDEPDYRKNGVAAHEALEACLREGLDAWEIVGRVFHDVTADVEIADAIQLFIDEVRPLMTSSAKVFIEFGVDAPDFHKDFYGTLDFGLVDGATMYVIDYKHGEGIAVDVEDNPQVKYYAYGLLRHHPEVEKVVLKIIQPRGFHPQGPVRTWETSADAIRSWAEGELLQAMLRTELDNDLDAGPWCRFCSAKLVCPLMTSLFGAAMTADPKIVVNLGDESLGRSYQYVQAVKFYLTALETETLRRLNLGHVVNGVKLVYKKANRVFKPEAQDIFLKEFGEDKVMKPPEFKSPAEMEKLGAKAKALVHEYAYTPTSGLTVALESDKRPAVKVQSTAEAFSVAIEGE